MLEKDAIKILNEFCQEKGLSPPTYFGKDTGNSKIPKFSFEVHLPIGIYGYPIEGNFLFLSFFFFIFYYFCIFFKNFVKKYKKR